MSPSGGPPGLVSRAWHSPADTRRMQALASVRLRHDWPATRFHPGDLDWWAVLTHGREVGMTDRVRLWFSDADETELAGFGWFAPPAELDLLLASDAPEAVTGLVDALVRWAATRRRELQGVIPDPGDGLRVWASRDETAAIAALEAHGHRLQATGGFVHFTGELEAAAAQWVEVPLPDGFEIRPLDRERDLDGRVACGRAAFGTSTMTPERYAQAFQAHLYRPDLDLVVSNDAGLVIAFALGWLDPASGVVLLEPVGVHPDWHRRGLGRAICQATLGAARRAGAHRGLVGTDADNAAAKGLYAGLGLRITATIVSLLGPKAEPA